MSVGEIQEWRENAIGLAAPKKTSGRKLENAVLTTLHVNISDRYTCATNILYSVSF